MDRAAVSDASPPSAALLRTSPRPRCLLCGAPGDGLHAAVADHIFQVQGCWVAVAIKPAG